MDWTKNKELWTISHNGNRIAEVHLFDNKIDSFVFWIEDKAIQDNIIKSALEQAGAVIRNKIDKDIYFHENRTFVVIAKFNDYVEVFSKLLETIRLEHLIGVESKEMPSYYWLKSKFIEFSVPQQNKFSFWNGVSMPYQGNTESMLHIVPPYHPVKLGYNAASSINGDTDCCIGGYDFGIESVDAPADARLNVPSFGTSWSHINHPFVASGSSFVVQFSPVKILSENGYEYFKKFLWGALGLNKTYIEVHGGFRSPYLYPPNLFRKKSIKSPCTTMHGVFNYRGSEHDCIWEYRTLKKEGKLDGAIIPSWFFRERWLELYADQEPEHGVC